LLTLLKPIELDTLPRIDLQGFDIWWYETQNTAREDAVMPKSIVNLTMLVVDAEIEHVIEMHYHRYCL
jgi:hypothetical protein